MRHGLNVLAAQAKAILNPLQAFLAAYRRAFDFHGRSRRSAYWWFVLFLVLGGLVFGTLDEYVTVPGFEDWSVFFILFSAVVVLPDLSLGMRRLHDTGRKGWLYVVYVTLSYGSIFLPEPSPPSIDFENNPSPGFLSYLGYEMLLTLILSAVIFLLMLVMIYLLTRDSQFGQNRYGPNPKGHGNADVFS